MYEGKLVRLRALRAEDAETAVRWLNDLETVQQISGGMALPVSLDEEKKWIEEHAGQKSDRQYSFAVETLDGKYIGNCDYFDLNWHDRTCKVGWLIGPEGRGKGYGTDMIRTLLGVCFDTLGMHKVSLDVMGFNDRAIRLYERIGFVREGVFREQLLARGRRWDEYRYGMLEREYRALAEEWGKE